ncbi:hypothetical protein BUALT_Bualt03G0062600 [Buddleja alternifolia]|uniref:Protein kinase domain-containing protein n=1 Tax=Buddleja alternifolia TaxID=168488 RepID=A0AAV6XY99_9LAMI|nr:hypothetical protein BUALT_Bualt03G0062600 [Buddleja alternifolia]
MTCDSLASFYHSSPAFFHATETTSPQMDALWLDIDFVSQLEFTRCAYDYDICLLINLDAGDYCHRPYKNMSCSCFGTSTVLRKKGHKHDHQSKREEEGASTEKTKKFSYNDLRVATNNFHRSNKIGRGGFGTVYKGILRNGTEVAVKTLSAESKQGEREFLTEIDTISNVKHPNLVELLGCCVHGPDKILVYEYLENNSIDKALLGARSGYLAPEYVLGGQLTLKADVYSFGVLTLEIVSGKSSANTNYGAGQKLLIEWVVPFLLRLLKAMISRLVATDETIKPLYASRLAWELYEEGKLLELVDPELEEFPKDEALRYMKVALFCTQANASRRPLMSQVIAMLSKNVRLNEKELTPPGFFEDSGGLNDKLTKNKSSEASTSHQMSSFPTTITQICIMSSLALEGTGGA